MSLLPPKLRKAELRKQWRARHLRAAELTREFSARIGEAIGQTPRFQTATRITLFYPRDWEIDLRPLWQQRPEHCYFPRVDPGTLVMSFYRIRALGDLRPGAYGIPEPPAEPGFLADRWEPADLILCPGLLFDRRGGRLGGGLGIYDRFLAGKPCERWGVCGSDQIVEEGVALEPTDVRMNALCTETGIWKVPGPGS